MRVPLRRHSAAAEPEGCPACPIRRKTPSSSPIPDPEASRGSAPPANIARTTQTHRGSCRCSGENFGVSPTSRERAEGLAAAPQRVPGTLLPFLRVPGSAGQMPGLQRRSRQFPSHFPLLATNSLIITTLNANGLHIFARKELRPACTCRSACMALAIEGAVIGCSAARSEAQ